VIHDAGRDRQPGRGVVVIRGRLIRGIECPAVQADDGRLYSLSERCEALPEFRATWPAEYVVPKGRGRAGQR
jgi:hypothetical protein